MAEQTLTGFLISKATQSRKEAKKQDRKEKRKKNKNTENKSDNKQDIGAKLSGGLSALLNIFSGKKPQAETSTKKQRSSGNATGLAKILSSGFGSLTSDNLQLSSALASITQLLNNSFKAQSFTASGVQTISAILSDQLENQSSILTTVKSLKPGGGGRGGGKGSFGTSKSVGVGADTLTGYLANKFDLGGQITRLLGRGVDWAKGKLFDKGAKAGAETAAKGGGKLVAEGAEAAAKKKLAQEVLQKGLSSKGAMINGKYVSVTAQEASQILASKAAPKAAQGPLAKLTGMIGGRVGQIAKGAKGLGGRMMAPITSRVAGMTGGKLGGKTAARLIPGAQTVLGLGFAGKELMDGDIIGAALSLGSAIPGPIGWGFLAADVAREVAGPQMVDKAFGQAIGGQIGFTDKQVADREKNMSATERVLTGMSGPSFMGLSSGGISSTINMASGGVGNVMVGEAAGSKGEMVTPLTSRSGKQMIGNNNGDPGMQTSAASTLAVVDQFIKGMGPLGAPVSQALGPDIQQLSRTFGMSQTLPNLRIGGGKFKEDGNARKNRDKFLEDLISGSLKALDAKKKDKTQAPPTTTPQTTQEQLTQSNPDNPDTGSVSQRQQNAQGSERPMDDYRSATTRGADHGRSSRVTPSLRPTQDTQRTVDFVHKGDNQKYKVLLNYSTGQYEVFKTGAGLLGTDMPVDLSNPERGKLNEALLRRAHNEAQYLYKIHAPGRGETVKYLSPDEAKKAKQFREAAKHGGGNQLRGGGIQSPNPVMPQTAPSMAPIGATNIANSQTNSVSIINIIGGSSGGGGSIPVSSSSPQDSSQYISDPFPKGLAGVLCMSPWSVV